MIYSCAGTLHAGFTARELETPEGYSFIFPNSLGEHGRVVASIDRPGTPFVVPAVYQPDGSIEFLPVPPDTNQAHGSSFALPDRVVGVHQAATDGIAKPVVWDSRGMTQLETIDGSGSVAAGTGSTYVGQVEAGGRSMGAVWNGTGLWTIDLGLPFLRITDINSQGRYVGIWRDNSAGNSNRGAIVGYGLSAELFAPTGFDQPELSDINDSGTMTGLYEYAGDFYRQGFVVRDGAISVLERLPGNVWGAAIALNNAGTVVGDCADDEGNLTAVAYFDGSLSPTDLNTLVDPLEGNVKLGRALDINNDGQILTWGISRTDGSWHYYVLTPVPEPGAVGVVLGIVGAVMFERRRGVSRRRSPCRSDPRAGQPRLLHRYASKIF